MTIVQLDTGAKQNDTAATPSVRSPLAGIFSQSLIRFTARACFTAALLVILFTWRQTGIW